MLEQLLMTKTPDQYTPAERAAMKHLDDAGRAIGDMHRTMRAYADALELAIRLELVPGVELRAAEYYRLVANAAEMGMPMPPAPKRLVPM